MQPSHSMPLQPGTTLGPYQVTVKIGEGGMGEVYRARDTKLDRDVALKVLPQAFTDDPDRLARFEREAKVLASLNHPNIGHIYGLEETEGQKALVLELVEGPTLAERIKQGPIPVDEALPIAKQIAEALEAAHEHGIIHRDLKPANIKVRDDGTVKVLDFGLAKAFQPDASDPNMSQSPTISLTAAATQMGMVIGTAAYMAPEQAKGRPVDKRADVWAFGVVLYEMLTGRKAFPGDDVSDTLATVLKFEPDWDALRADTPSSVRRLLRRCLSKDVKLRLRDAGDAVLELLQAQTEGPIAETKSTSATAPRVRSTQTAVALAVVVAAVGGLLGWNLVGGSRVESAPVSRFAIRLPLDMSVLGTGRSVAAISRDGRMLAYIGDNGQLFRRSLDQLDSVPIRGTEGASTPFFSPDGEWIGFASNGQLRKVSIAGGPPTALCPISTFMRGGSWGSDDQIVFSVDNVGLLRVPAAGGTPEILTEPDPSAGELFHLRPHVLPGANAVLFTAWLGTTDTSKVEVLSFETGERRTLANGNNPHYLLTGHVVFARSDSLWAVPFDIERLDVLAPPVPVLEGVWIGRQFAPQFALSAGGALIYVPGAGSAASMLAWIDRTGRETALNLPSGNYTAARLSPDGERIALLVSSLQDLSHLWISEVARNTLTRLTSTDSSGEQTGSWTPDGERVVFVSYDRDQESRVGLFSKLSDGTGDVSRLASEVTPYAALWGPMRNEQQFVVHYGTESAYDIGLVSLDGEPSWEPLVATQANEVLPVISPDGRWLAYMSDESGDMEVYVQRFPDSAGVQRVSTSGGVRPMWGPDGRELFYVNQNVMMAASVTEGEASLRIAVPEPLFESSFPLAGPTSFVDDISPDGQSFLLIRQVGSVGSNSREPELIVVENWHQELLERVPVRTSR